MEEQAAPSHRRPATGCFRLVELIASGAVAPLRGSAVLALAAAGKPLPARREVPEKAFWTAAQLSELLDELTAKFGEEEAERRLACIFVGISCHWLIDDDPDPDGFHLQAVAQAAQAYMSEGGGGGGSSSSSDDAAASPGGEVFEPLGRAVDCALLWDHAVVPRGSGYDGGTAQDRSAWPPEAREALALWLCHPRMPLWMQTDSPSGGLRGLPELRARKYAVDGWCHLERCLAQLAKPSHLTLDLGRRKGLGEAPSYGLLRAACAWPRGPPLPPPRFAAALGEAGGGIGGRALFFAAPQDEALAAQLYTEGFEEIVPRATRLDVHGLGWTPPMVQTLLGSLPSFSSLERLDLSCGTLGGPAGGAGAGVGAASGTALLTCLGRLPGLTALSASGTWLGDEGAQALSDGLRSSARALARLYLDGCGLAEGGACCACPRAMLRVLRVPCARAARARVPCTRPGTCAPS